MSEFLSPDELRDLTQRARRESQARVLQEAGIPFRQVAARFKIRRRKACQFESGRGHHQE